MENLLLNETVVAFVIVNLSNLKFSVCFLKYISVYCLLLKQKLDRELVLGINSCGSIGCSATLYIIKAEACTRQYTVQISVS